MRLAQLFSIYPQYRMGQEPEVEISGVTSDSRQITTASVFVAIRGHNQDGHQYLPQVCQQNIAGVVVEDDRTVPKDFKGAVVVVNNTRVALDQLAARYYGHPAEQMFCVGVTGTNGKTSTTYMIEAILNHFGWPTGVMGTVNHHLKNHVWESQLTTPDPLTLQKRLSEFRALKASAVAFEVSSHALAQHRADAIPFDVAVFTNLTRDHLDFHKSMENYFAAKQKLFSEVLGSSKKSKLTAVVNSDDSYGRQLQICDRARKWTYGANSADFCFQVLEESFAGTKFLLRTPRGEKEFFIPLVGRHNVYNATAAIAVAMAAGASLLTCSEALAKFSGVPGRLERILESRDIHVFVDYAHTDDALKTVLSALNEVRQQAGLSSRIITVFGCGGDRDQGKRPLMAQAAARGSDLVFITSDNPRSEDPAKIIDDCVRGVPAERVNQDVFIEIDRRTAIVRALQSAHTGDVILIAGKGHENYQIIGAEKLPFSDGEVVREWLK